MKYCEFKSDYYQGTYNSRTMIAKEGDMGVLDGYTSEPTPRAIVILDSGDIVIVHIGFIQVRYITEPCEMAREKFFDCYYDKSTKNNSENEK